MSAFYCFYPPSSPPVGGATAANQVIQIGLETQIEANTAQRGQDVMANSIPVVIASDQSPIDVNLVTPTHVTVDQGTTPWIVDGSGVTQPISAVSLPLPTGAATDANQALEITALNSIDSKLTSPLAVTGPLTNTQLRAADVGVLINNSSVPVRGNGITNTAVTGNTLLVSGEDSGVQRNLSVDSTGKLNVNVSGSALPAGAATSANQTTEIAAINTLGAKSASGIVPEAFDYQDITYVGASTDVDQVIYKLGGAGGTVVATLTMGYDGSNRLTSVTKT